MKGKGRQLWIQKGYEMISEIGFADVKVETIARALEKNKSSFYYYFGDWEGFEEELLDHHLVLAGKFAQEVNQCKSIIPDMVHTFIDHKTDLFFHKQLRIHREKPHFKKCFESVYVLFEEAVDEKWTAFLNLRGSSLLATRILTLLSENFLLQITHDNYHYSWIENYLQETANLVRNMNPPGKN